MNQINTVFVCIIYRYLYNTNDMDEELHAVDLS